MEVMKLGLPFPVRTWMNTGWLTKETFLHLLSTILWVFAFRQSKSGRSTDNFILRPLYFYYKQKLKAITINLYVLVWFKYFLEYLISWSYTKTPDSGFIFSWQKLDSRKSKLTPHIIIWFAGWPQRYSNCLIGQTLWPISSMKVAFTSLL